VCFQTAEPARCDDRGRRRPVRRMRVDGVVVKQLRCSSVAISSELPVDAPGTEPPACAAYLAGCRIGYSRIWKNSGHCNASALVTRQCGRPSREPLLIVAGWSIPSGRDNAHSVVFASFSCVGSDWEGIHPHGFRAAPARRPPVDDHHALLRASANGSGGMNSAAPIMGIRSVRPNTTDHLA